MLIQEEAKQSKRTTIPYQDQRGIGLGKSEGASVHRSSFIGSACLLLLGLTFSYGPLSLPVTSTLESWVFDLFALASNIVKTTQDERAILVNGLFIVCLPDNADLVFQNAFFAPWIIRRSVAANDPKIRRVPFSKDKVCITWQADHSPFKNRDKY